MTVRRSYRDDDNMYQRESYTYCMPSSSMPSPDEVLKKICLFFTPKAMAKLTAYVKAVPGEIGGFGIAQSAVLDADNPAIVIEDVFIVKQRVSTGSVDIEPEALMDAVTRMMTKGIGGKTDPALIKLWFHCHPGTTISTNSWSGIDEDGINALGGPGVDWFASVLLSGNASQIVARLDILHPVRICFNNIKCGVLPEVNDEITREVQEDIEKYVEKTMHTVTGHNLRRFGYSQDISSTGKSYQTMFGNRVVFKRRPSPLSKELGGSHVAEA